MEHYNTKYTSTIEKLYGDKRNIETDKELMKDNTLPYGYTINERIDMTMYSTYSIDPDGCEDADDAFSIYEKDEKLFLAIHIADPTEYINIQSSLWKDIEERVVTKYPSNTKPIHMMPKEIMDKASLMVNDYGDIKLAITILTEINKDTYHPMSAIKILFTKIKVDRCNALSYKEASDMIYSNNTIYNGFRISKALKEIRGGKTKGVILNELSNSYPKYANNVPYLYCDTTDEKMMKQMIAEFAIFANSFVGEYLKINFEGKGLYRICSAKDWLNTVYEGISGQDLLNEIIVNGIKAEYLTAVSAHDLVGAPEYCHFTSPIRRLSDCVCHYLLKYIHLKKKSNYLIVPFINTQLEKYSNDCIRISNNTKKIQYKDIKFRMIQTMSQMLSDGHVLNIGYFVSGCFGRFLNIIINSINDHSIYISYTLRVDDSHTEYNIKEMKYINITKVKCVGKFDQGSIPELDAMFI